MIIPNLTSNNSEGFTVTSSLESSWSGGGAAYKAFDSSASTGWYASAVPAWLAVDCGDTLILDSFKIKSRHNYSENYNGFLNAFEILGSNDGSTWTILKAFSGISWTNGEEKEFVLDTVVESYRHFKINVTQGSTGNVIINGFQLYGAVIDKTEDDVVSDEATTLDGGDFLFGVEKLGNGETKMRVSEDAGQTWKQYIPKDGFREVYIMAGQSNMVGHGALSQLPTFSNSDKCFVYGYDEQWDAGQEPMSEHSGIVYSVFYDNDDKASMGMSFASKTSGLSPCNEVGLVPCAKGGSGIAAWQRDLSTSSLYGAMIARANAALQQENTILKGLVWYQGEEDAKTSSNAAAWKDRFEQFVKDVRSDLGYNIPVVCVRLGPTTQTSERPHWSTVQSQQDMVELNDYALVTASDLSVGSDGVHLNTASLVTLGSRVAEAMSNLQ